MITMTSIFNISSPSPSHLLQPEESEFLKSYLERDSIPTSAKFNLNAPLPPVDVFSSNSYFPLTLSRRRRSENLFSAFYGTPDHQSTYHKPGHFQCKHGHEKRKSTKEARAAKPKPGKVKAVVNLQVKNDIPMLLISHLSIKDTVEERKAQGKGHFTLVLLSEVTQAVTSRIATLAIRLNGRGAYNGRAPMDSYWLIINKPELLISSLSSFTFVWLRFLISPDVAALKTEVLNLRVVVRTSALADSGASINLLPHSIYKQLGLGALTPTRMTLELANRSIMHPMGIAEDVVVRVDDEPFSGSTTNHSDALPPSSSPVKTSDNLEEFADELTLSKKDVHFQVYSIHLFEFDDNFTSSNEMVEDVVNKNSNVSDEPVLLNTPLTDKVECSDPEDDIDEIDAFLAMEVSSDFKEGYFDSEGDITFLDNLLCDDLTPEVISDHELEQNESSITFSPRSDPLHHEFAGEIITLPLRIVRQHEDYLNCMTLLSEISISRSQGEMFTANQNVENDDSEEEDNELPNLDHQDDPLIPRPPPEPPDVEKCLEPEAGLNQQIFEASLVVVFQESLGF
ncbi:reverse transcriptase domain-containing protein [Tanacetum coccineum]